jgi:membrane associated rhomboid family serine protease
VYLLAGLAGEGASLVFSDAVTVGASGAIFGLLGAPTGRAVMFLQGNLAG